MPRTIVKVAVALLLIALVWKVLTGDEGTPAEEIDRID